MLERTYAMHILLLKSRTIKLCIFLTCYFGHGMGLHSVKQWKTFSYNFLPNAPTSDVNFYNPNNILATGLAVTHDRIFIATPKLFSGVPSTVNYVSKTEFGDTPNLQAYPDWSFSTTGRTDFNCSDLVLISVYRLRLDSCNRLWVLDAGVSRSLEDYQVTCPPKILVIDLRTDQVVRRIEFPREVLRGESLFTNLVIDETTSTKSAICDDVFVYISDTVEPAIVVYDSKQDVTWRVSHPSMYPDPDFAQSEILGDRFILMDGIVGLTFDEKSGLVYFQPLATDRVFSVHKDVLRAGPLSTNQILDVKLVGKKSSQGIGMTVSPIDGSLLFSPLSETAVASWNPTTNKQSVLAYDPERLQFVADMTVSASESGAVFLISSKFHRFFLKTLNTGEVNNRILRITLPEKIFESNGFTRPVLDSVPTYGLSSFVTADSPSLSVFRNDNGFKSTFSHAHSPLHTTPIHNNYFISSKHPYSYETVGIINYSERNPFFALNHGETFPSNKRQKDSQQPSFLDNLDNLPTTATIHTQTPKPLSASSYYFGRVSHATKRNDQVNTTAGK